MNADYHGATKAPTSRKIDSCFWLLQESKGYKGKLVTTFLGIIITFTLI